MVAIIFPFIHPLVLFLFSFGGLSVLTFVLTKKEIENQILECVDLIDQGLFNIAVIRLDTIPVKKKYPTFKRKVLSLKAKCTENILLLQKSDRLVKLYRSGYHPEAVEALEGILDEYSISQTPDRLITDYAVNQMRQMLRRMMNFI